MSHKPIFICLFFLSTSVFADANDGDYLGFTLGERFSVPRGAVSKDHITGALVYIVNPVQRMQHIGSLSVYVSPKSSIVGSVFGEWYFASERSAQVFADRYLRTLEEKYPHWIRRRGSLNNGEYQLWVDLEKKPPIVDHWPSHKNFRVGVALGFVRDSAQQNQWAATLHKEIYNLDLTASQ